LLFDSEEIEMFAGDLKRFKLTAVLLLFCCHGLIGQDVFSPTDAATRIHESAIHVSGVKTPNGGPVDAVQGIVAAFRRHPVVLIGEAHWLRQAGNLYMRLVRDPSFQENVQDLVVEFASRNNQPLIDRYISGGDVPAEELRRIWRDTTKVISWESPIYAELLATVREVNQKLPPDRRLRVLASDTAIDWNNIHNHSEWAALGDNNVSIADVIQRQVLEKKRHALVILGGNHVTKPGDRHGGPNTTTRVEAAYPGSTYVVLLYGAQTGWEDHATEDLLHTPAVKPPTFYQLADSALSASALAKYADALLYLGDRESLTMVFPSRESIEPAYLQEVDRRSMIEWGDLRGRKFMFTGEK
jgi:hypothetical protein